MEGLFEDLLVVDCASFIAGPAAATIFADFGARVIKIEPPGGDGYRQFIQLPGMPPSSINYPWLVTNRNKENICLDLKAADGREALDRLLSRADIFITNYPLPVRNRLRLNAADLMRDHPHLIYASLTPYGETGPDADLRGYDATAWWARSGLMDAVRANQQTEPAISVPGMGDYPSGMALYGAIVSALYRRERTGEGAEVCSSLLANGLWSNSLRTQAALAGADMRVNIRRGQRSALTELYRCSDDRWLLLTLLPQVQEAKWPDLAHCMAHPEWLEAPDYSNQALRQQHNERLLAQLEAAFARRTRDEWIARLEQYGLTYGLITTPEDLLSDPQPTAAGMLRPIAAMDDLMTVDSPIHIRGEAKQSPRAPASLGADSERILAELGYPQDEIEQLLDRGIVVQHRNEVPE